MQRRQPGRDDLLGPRHAAIAGEEQQPAQDQRRAPVNQLRSRHAAQEQPAKDQRARHQEARASHQQWRHRLDRHLNSEIGRAPDDVDCEESGADLQRQSWITRLRYRIHAVSPRSRRSSAVLSSGMGSCPVSLSVCQHDGRARRAHRRDRAKTLAQQVAERLGIGDARLDEIAILAGDVVNLLHLGNRAERFARAQRADRLIGVHVDVGDQPQTKRASDSASPRSRE